MYYPFFVALYEIIHRNKTSCDPQDDSRIVLFQPAFIMDFVCRWCEASGFTFRHDRIYGADRYVIRFDMGPNWAIFFGKFVQTIGEQFKDKNLESKIINNTIFIKIIDSHI